MVGLVTINFGLLVDENVVSFVIVEADVSVLILESELEIISLTVSIVELKISVKMDGIVALGGLVLGGNPIKRFWSVVVVGKLETIGLSFVSFSSKISGLSRISIKLGELVVISCLISLEELPGLVVASTVFG